MLILNPSKKKSKLGKNNINDYGEIYRYEELLDEFIEYQKALKLKDKLEIDF